MARPPARPEETAMFKHIMIPTDGSQLSQRALEGGIELARTLGARVTAFHVIPRFHASDVIMGLLAESKGDYERAAQAYAHEQLEVATRAARAAGVACEVAHATGDDVAREIVAVASRIGCDLILMASHGRRGIEGVLLGSETHKVLTHSQVPVLVYR
jgi:nucleotide-binding universal stress UspA family protein